MDKNFWQDRPVFVTGATGLVGSWLVKELVQAGADTVCLVRDWVPQSEFVSSQLIEQVRVVRGDITDQEFLERVLGEYEIETVIHLAAQTIVGIANRNPVSTFESNIRGTWCLLEACRRSPKVGQIVVASSDKAYGIHEDLPYNEETPLKGEHPYDVSKSCADLISLTYAKSFGLPVIVTRCGNFYGGGDLNWNRLIPGTIRSVFRGQAPIIRSDGTFLRDYFYVEDGARAYMHLAESLANNPELKGEAFNLSTETPTTVLEAVSLILELMGSELNPVILDEVRNEIPNQYLDAAKAKTMLNWGAEHDLRSGLEKTITWYTEFLTGSDK